MQNEAILHVGPTKPGCCGEGGCEVEAAREREAKIFWFVDESEIKDMRIRPGEITIKWTSDEKVKTWMHHNIEQFKGGQIFGDDKRTPRLAEILKQVVELYNFDTSSMKFLTSSTTPNKNVLRNFQYLERGLSLKRAKDSAKGCRAICIMAGPSLNGMWEDLKRIRPMEKTVFIVCGRSYRAAASMGLGLDFVVEVEQFDWDDKIWQFAPPPHPNSILCFPLTVCAGVPHAWTSPKMVLLDHNMAQMFESEGYKVGEDSMDGGNSIAHFMFNLSVHIGCKEIYFAGLDFGYPDGEQGMTHADGTFHPWPAGVLTTEHTHQEPAWAVANDGSKLRTSPPYLNFGLYMEMLIYKRRDNGREFKVFNFSEKALKMEGIEYFNIKDFKEEKCLKDSSGGSSLGSALLQGSQPASISSNDTSGTQEQPLSKPSMTPTTPS